MGRIDELAKAYRSHISLPWRPVAAEERVIFCVYNERDELRLRAKISEFELATTQAEHDWELIDLTDSFGKWMSTQKYSTAYFETPENASDIYHRYLESIVELCEQAVDSKKLNEKSVLALCGVGSLFGLVSVKELVDKLAPLVRGRLVVFFPGTLANNIYRLLDGYDGWNYLAVPIT